MKRITKIFVIMLLLLMMSPLAAIAAPKGYMEVNLTKKNFKKYFEVVKMKYYDSFGDYDGYSFILKSKLLKKKYYIYKVDDFAIKYSAKERFKYKYKKKTYKNTFKRKTTITSFYGFAGEWNGGGNKYDYKYGKLSKFKVLKAKGKLVFIEPSNVKGIKKIYDDDGKYDHSVLMLKYPYDKHTYYESHWDDDKDKDVIDYYYLYLDSQNLYYNGKNKYGTFVR